MDSRRPLGPEIDTSPILDEVQLVLFEPAPLPALPASQRLLLHRRLRAPQRSSEVELALVVDVAPLDHIPVYRRPPDNLVHGVGDEREEGFRVVLGEEPGSAKKVGGDHLEEVKVGHSSRSREVEDESLGRAGREEVVKGLGDVREL